MVAALKHVVAATVFVVLGAGIAAAQSDTERQRAKDAVVMIKTQLPGGTQRGAGIIVAVTQREVYVATANHMVRRGGKASSIELQFASAPGRWVNATLLDFLDADLDLAAVVAPLPQNLNAAALRTIVAAPPQQLRREMDVFALGYPRERAWNLPVLADKVASTSAYRIVFQSNYVQPGNSGGALLDGCGRIVGMVIETDPPEATAVRIESVLDAVRSWNLPTQPSLTMATNACGGAILPPVEPAKGTTVAQVPVPTPVPAPAPAAPATPATCSVTINSTPTGADVYLDGARNGTTSRTVTLQRDRRYSLRLTKTGFEALEREIDCNSSPVRATLAAATTDITLQYAGDPLSNAYGCALQVNINIGGVTATPTSNPFSMNNVPLGRQNYTITGQVVCTTLGGPVCAAQGRGTITVDEDDTFGLQWVLPGIGQPCPISLMKQ